MIVIARCKIHNRVNVCDAEEGRRKSFREVCCFYPGILEKGDFVSEDVKLKLGQVC